MLYTKLSTPGMCHGISHETEALKKYVESLTAKSLFVTADNPGLIILKRRNGPWCFIGCYNY